MNNNRAAIKVVLITDIHYGSSYKTRPGEEAPGLIARFVEAMNQDIKPDVIMELGDRINNADTETEEKNLSFLVESLDRSLDAPCYHVFGNHDGHNLDKKTISLISGSETGMTSRVIKGFKFISLDTVDPIIEGCGGTVGKEQLTWLEREMNTDDYPKLVFGHHPIDDHTMKGNNIITPNVSHLIFLENKHEVRNVLEKGNNFIAYFCGHMHWFSFLYKHPASYIVVPSFIEAYPLKSGAPGAFLEADIYTNGKVEAALHTLNPRRLLGRFTSKESTS
jgi:hypothetical protein